MLCGAGGWAKAPRGGMEEVVEEEEEEEELRPTLGREYREQMLREEEKKEVLTQVLGGRSTRSGPRRQSSLRRDRLA